jgi:hypothetical protein
MGTVVIDQPVETGGAEAEQILEARPVLMPIGVPSTLA